MQPIVRGNPGESQPCDDLSCLSCWFRKQRGHLSTLLAASGIEWARRELWPTPVANDDNKTPAAHLAMKERMGGNRTAITSLQVYVQAWPRREEER